MIFYLAAMIAKIYSWLDKRWQARENGQTINEQEVQLVLCFAAKELLTSDLQDMLSKQFPSANIAMVSTAGEIFGSEVLTGSAVVAALAFEHTEVEANVVNVREYDDSFEAGIALIKPLVAGKTPRHILVFSDGQLVNGSELVKGLNSVGDGSFLITGGLAGDGENFGETLLGLNGKPVPGNIMAISFYSKKLKVRHGCKGGWEPFGMMKKVTSSHGNVVYEIDSKPALDVYRELLGKDAEGLPGTALLYPLCLYLSGSKLPVVRTTLSIDEEKRSVTFAGDIPEGCFVRFMRATLDKITDAASVAAVDTHPFPNQHEFALLISCVGRRMVLGSRASEELKAIDIIFDKQTPLAGFYSYGEISPLVDDTTCQLHNQTMTITAFSEDYEGQPR